MNFFALELLVMKLIPDVSTFLDKNKERSADPKGAIHSFELVITVLLFLLVGRLVDIGFNTTPIFTLAFATLGFTGSFASAFYRYKATSAKLDEGKVWSEKKERGHAPVLEETPDELIIPKGYGQDD